MMNRKQRHFSVISAMALGGMLAATIGLTGCSAEEDEPVVRETAPPPPPPAPSRPTVRSVDDLKAELRIDNRVIMTEDIAPGTTEERKAILTFFDAFARGDNGALARQLSDLDQRELDRMVESGQWDKATRGIEEVMIFQTGDSPNGKAVVALYLVDGSDQVQMWYYTGRGDEFTFEAAPTPPNMANRLSGTDWISAWHAILQEEMELALRPDEVFETPQQVLDESTSQEGDRSPSGAPGGPSRPTTAPPSAPRSTPPPRRRVPGGQPPG
jgi:hypothetical protein